MIKILFLAADPLSNPANGLHPRLLLDENLRQIRDRIRQAEHRDVVDLEERWAVRTDDLLLALNEVKPPVVHFSGHGGSEGLVLVGRDGQRPHPVGTTALRKLFEAFRGETRLVVLSACFSLPQAQAIADVVGCAIGTPSRILDQAALTFDAAFYRAIAFGKSVRAAYDQGLVALSMEGFPDHECPLLLTAPGVDPAQLFLIPPGEGEPEPDAAAGPRDETPVQPGPPAVAHRPRGLWVGTAGVVVALTGAALFANVIRGAQPEAEPRIQPLVSAAAPHDGSGMADVLAPAKDLYQAGNHSAALPLFRQAAEAENYEAMGYLGVMHLRGEGTPRQPDSAYHWVRHAATRGRDARSMNALGMIYQTGQGAEQSPHWARHWYTEAAKKGYPEAMRNLAGLYRQAGNDSSYRHALAWYRKAAEAGSLDAMVDLGQMHAEGLGTPRDPAAAVRLYQAAAEAGSPRGMLAIGQSYEHGAGVPRSFAKAMTWYRRAAEARSADAMNNIGVMYLNGWGVPRNRNEALRWFRQAAQLGSTVAAANLAALEGE